MATLSTGRLIETAVALRADLESLIAAPARGVVLEVVSGFHAGAQLEVDENVDTIGSGAESMIVLKDEGIAPLHARIVPRGGKVDLEAIGGDIGLPGGEVIHEGYGRRWTLPVELTLGGAQVRLRNTERQSRQSTFFSTGPALVAVVLVSTVVALAANSLSQAGAAPETSVALAGLSGSAATQPTGEIADVNPAAPAAQAMSAGDALEQLRARLADAGIDTVSLAERDGRVVASGTLTKNQSQSWTEIQSWFDQVSGNHVPLASDVSIDSMPSTPRLAMQAIWYGERPYVIAADGARYYEGAFLEGGWTIESIDETALVLTKDGASFALRYQ